MPKQPKKEAARSAETGDPTAAAECPAGEAEHTGLPQRMVNTPRGPEPAPADDPDREVLSPEQIIQAKQERERTALLQDETMIPETLRDSINLHMLRVGVDMQAAKADLPFNHKQVPDGARATIHTVDTVAEASVMKPRIIGLDQDLVDWDRLALVAGPIELAYDIIQANKSQILGRMAGKVKGGLDRVESLLDNPSIERGLADALAIRGEPAAEAQATKADHQRLASQTQGAATPAPATPPATQTTVTTTSQPTVPTTPPAPPAASKGTLRKR